MLAELHALLQPLTNANRCHLGTEEQDVVSSILRAFPEDVAVLLEGRAPAPRQISVPISADRKHRTG